MEVTPWRKSVFEAWLHLGGVSTGQKDFNAPDNSLAMNAVDFVDEPAQGVEIDFPFLARVFFSERCIAAAGYGPPSHVRHAPEVIINFLKYINAHNVLPEFRDQIDVTIRFAEMASLELCATKHLSLLLPGPLNNNLSALHHGQQALLKEGLTVERALPESKVWPEWPLRVIHGMPVEVQEITKIDDCFSHLTLRPWTDIEGLGEQDQYETDLLECKVLLENEIAMHIFPKCHL